jgi:hypothetical protein
MGMGEVYVPNRVPHFLNADAPAPCGPACEYALWLLDCAWERNEEKACEPMRKAENVDLNDIYSVAARALCEES